MAEYQLNELREKLYKAALDKGLITPSALERYKAALAAAENYNGEESAFQAVRNAIHEGIPEDKSLTSEEIDVDSDLLDISRLSALEEVVVNAFNDNQTYSNPGLAPKHRFTQLFKKLLGSSEAINQDALQRLAETKNKMILSLVHTMHPVVYHTVEGRELEKDLTAILEQKGTAEDFGNRLEKFVGEVVDGKSQVTPMKPINTNKENEIEDVNIKAIEKEIEEVVAAWNEAAAEYGVGEQLNISEEDRNRIFEMRSWGKFADADGREKSTAFNLYNTIRENTHSGVYTGPILDLRQNASVHQVLVSALIQKTFWSDDRFEEPGPNNYTTICSNFVERLNNDGKKVGRWKNTRESIYLELDDKGKTENKSEFLKMLMNNNISIIPDDIKAETEQYVSVFNKKFWEIFEGFIKEKREKGVIKPPTTPVALPEGVTFEDLGRYNSKEFPKKTLLDEFLDRITQVTVNISGVETGMHFSKGQFYPLRPILGSYKYIEGMETIHWVNQKGKDIAVKENIDGETRAVAMDSLRRLIVMKQAIGDETKGTIKEVGKLRHQIANFSGEDNFYEMLILFREAGLVKIDKGKVSNVKMGIMPLIETIEDFKKAPDIFNKLLGDPLAVSYFRERGKAAEVEGGLAEIMVGFSDGAKSAGNFASQWEIYKTTKELHALFKQHGIALRVFEGRGRGIDRGGPIDLGISSFMMPAELAETAVKDMTIQADLPVELANSNAFGKNQLASLMIGVAEAREMALTKDKSDEAVNREKAFEALAEKIAVHSSEVFQKVVKDNEAVLDYIDSMPSNSNISSRNAKRSNPLQQKVYNDIRAVPIEQRANTADLPFHNVGLREALNDVFKMKDEDLQALGFKPGDFGNGKEAVAAFIREHPLGKSLFTTLRIGMSNYDPVIATEMARVAAGEEGNPEITGFVKKSIKSLNGLINKLDSVLGNSADDLKHMIAKHHSVAGVKQMDLLDTLSHAACSLLPNFKLNKSGQYPNALQILNNFIFGCYNEVTHRGPNIVQALQQTVANALEMASGGLAPSGRSFEVAA